MATLPGDDNLKHSDSDQPGPAGTPVAHAAPGRIATIDAVRGMAVLGILVMNIGSFAMPMAAYTDPTAYGGAQGLDLQAWAAAMIFADGKMRGLFTLLFGASIAIVAEAAARRGANPVEFHYWRMAWLLVIGMLHGALLWYGDILVEYAIIGAVLFAALRWRPAALFYAAAVLFLAEIAGYADNLRAIIALKAAALKAGASATDIAAWRGQMNIDPAQIAHQLDAYRGDAAAVFAIRRSDLLQIVEWLPFYLIEGLGTAALGMALYRTGYFTRWPHRLHWRLILLGFGLGVPVTAIGTYVAVDSGFDPVAKSMLDLVVATMRPAIMLGYASTLILLVGSGRGGWLAKRLAAAGRMALTNYLATSVVMTTVFYGYGLGWFGYLSRAELVPVVIAMWVVMLAWSLPWLARFRYGPAEWLWRSLTIGRTVPLRGPATTD